MSFNVSAQPSFDAFPDFWDFLENLRENFALAKSSETETRESIFEINGEVHIARAPGRLDVMGGISDYSGGFVLQMPIQNACFAAAQRTRRGNQLQVLSQRAQGLLSSWQCEATEMNGCCSYEDSKRLFTKEPWVSYIVGCLTVLKFEGYITTIPPMSIFLCSNVPEGAGVSSSAAIEVAAMKAFLSILDLDLAGTKIAELCQKVENDVVRAPCGIMDQMTAAIGRKDHLLALSCRPASVLGFLPIPPHLSFIGIDSTERHSIAGADYSTIRAAAFMGFKIFKETTSPAKTDCQYLTELIDSEEDIAKFESYLPETLTGADFTQQYGTHLDQATEVYPECIYPIKAATCHPLREIKRVWEFHSLLQSSSLAEDCGHQLGGLMYAAHEAYRILRLDSKWTTALVRLAKEERSGAVYGAKITGGGSGGSVCFLVSTENQERVVMEICQRFKECRGSLDEGINVFSGSSDGAEFFGIIKCSFFPHKKTEQTSC